MSAWIATALTVAITAMSAITAVNAGSCGAGSTQNCFNCGRPVSGSRTFWCQRGVLGRDPLAV